MDKAREKYRAPALEKGLDIVELLAEHGNGLSQSDIAGALNRSQSEIYRMLTTLVRRGYVVRTAEADRYVLSLKTFVLSQRHPPVSRLLELAAPRMRALARRAWQSCHLGMESNGDIVVVASAESPGNWGLALRVGTVIGLGNTGTGRVLAAFCDRRDFQDLVDQHRLAAGEPPIDRDALSEHARRIRQLGYERMPSATAIGITNLSYPVFDNSRRAIAAVTCPFLERIDDLAVPALEEVHAMLQSLASELTTQFCGLSPMEEEAAGG